MSGTGCGVVLLFEEVNSVQGCHGQLSSELGGAQSRQVHTMSPLCLLGWELVEAEGHWMENVPTGAVPGSRSRGILISFKVFILSLSPSLIHLFCSLFLSFLFLFLFFTSLSLPLSLVHFLSLSLSFKLWSYKTLSATSPKGSYHVEGVKIFKKGPFNVFLQNEFSVFIVRSRNKSQRLKPVGVVLQAFGTFVNVSQSGTAFKWRVIHAFI